MTEEEAKTKWCPMVRKLTFRETSAFSGSHTPNNEEAKCVGSACMMWRTYRVPNGKEMVVEQNGVRMVAKGIEGSDEHGYCGLAGTP